MRRALPISRNFLALERSQSALQTSSVVIQQAPFERTTSYGKGAAKGPQAILKASHQVELFDAALGLELVSAIPGIATLPPVAPGNRDGRQYAQALRDETAHWIQQGKFVVTLGGEHTAIVGAIQAHCEAWEDLTVLQLDAHSDLRDEYDGSPWNHACAMARVLDFHSHIVQMGIRSQCREEREKTEVLRTPVIYAHQILTAPHGEESWIKRVIGACRKRVYVTFDYEMLRPGGDSRDGHPGTRRLELAARGRPVPAPVQRARRGGPGHFRAGAHPRHPSPAVQRRKTPLPVSGNSIPGRPRMIDLWPA